MPQLISILGGIVQREVQDETGVHDVFDIALEWSPDEVDASPTHPQDRPSIFTALEEQAGLKLEARKASTPFWWWIMSRAPRGTEN